MRLWRNRKERWRTVLTNTSLTLDNNKNRNVFERILRKCIPESSSCISIMWNDPRGKKMFSICLSKKLVLIRFHFSNLSSIHIGYRYLSVMEVRWVSMEYSMIHGCSSHGIPFKTLQLYHELSVWSSFAQSSSVFALPLFSSHKECFKIRSHLVLQTQMTQNLGK